MKGAAGIIFGIDSRDIRKNKHLNFWLKKIGRTEIRTYKKLHSGLLINWLINELYKISIELF
jgi:hypothetical protein